MAPLRSSTKKMPVIVIAPRDGIFEKTASKHAGSRGARREKSFSLARPEWRRRGGACFRHHRYAADGFTRCAIVYALPIQLLAYHTALVMGKDVDQPRNLAKSVTVE